MTNTARVTLKRLPRPMNDLFRAYWIVIDGRRVGTIHRRNTKTFEVAPGHHEIYLTIDWCRSQSLEVDLSPGQEVKLVCKARPMSRWAWLARRDDYIELDVEEPGSPISNPS